MARPFIVVGAMKCGTTTLEHVLRDIRGIQIVGEKESSGFLDPERGGVVAHKILASDSSAAGEVSTAYMQRPIHEIDTGQVVKSLGSDLVVIATLRDPLTRAVSHWRHWAQLGNNLHDNLADALMDAEGPYVGFSRYAYQLDPWVEAVGRDQILPLKVEDYAEDPWSWIVPLCEKLGVATPNDAPTVHANAADSRVIARGIGKRLGNSRAYRRIIRPLTPPTLRRGGLRLLGGSTGGHQTDAIPATVEKRFRELLADDSKALSELWPGLAWE